MSKVDEMFEKLGYKREKEDEDENREILEPEYDVKIITSYYKKRTDERIEFWDDKTVNKVIMGDVGYIDMQELQAINEKCKELGWLE